MTYIQVIIEIIKNINSRLTDQTDLSWTKYKRAFELKSELEKDIQELNKGNQEILEKFNLYFAPTGTFQEIAIPNGWGEDFILMANDFDKLYKKIKAST
ncbi:hypothetical protein [Psychroserpens algicola]|uniref:Uncharacterized protein n=1 Tax=Psychroserpens algicola TaxID=1719034 RepID=A0ABT0HDR6_9FLAO|nr:hypothetical protein [Psychroserpens algicola]MCK8482337.1 hypothetical protein [Psychroserpens algicola]